MKKYLCLLIALLLLLSACGKNASSKPAQSGTAQSEPAAQEETAEEAPAESGTPVKDEAAPQEPVHPYAWLGLQDMPQCNYLDILCTNYYYQVYDRFFSGLKYEVVDAAAGIDAFQEDEYTKTLTVGGMIYSIGKNAETYMQYDMTSMADQAQQTMEYALANGTNMKGRAFQDTGRGTIPLYSDEGDTAEYEYYEYLTSNPGVNDIIERFYMKDGDVFAIYSLTKSGDEVLEERTDVIKSITADIPAGVFEIPDLSGYEKLN